MEGTRFDEMTRRLSAVATRRRVLGVAAGFAAGATFAGEAAAGTSRTCLGPRRFCWKNAQCCSGVCPTGTRVSRRERNRCSCGALTLCGRACIDTQTDAQHCGGCGHACDDDETCVSGVCELKLDCTTYDGNGYESGGSWCVTTSDGDAVLSRSCGRITETECTSSSDCDDEPTGLGETAYCGATIVPCAGPFMCKGAMILGEGKCVVTRQGGCD